MGIVNRRNAVMGWTVWNVGKRIAKRKAKAALPGTAEGSRAGAPKLLVPLAGLGAALFFWRRRSGDESPQE
jgi:hypothetical protein